MIRVAITKADDLADLYRQLVAGQEAAHGADYCSHHAAIMAAAGPNCRTYAELGVNQGTTLACAILSGFRWLDAVDLDLKRLQPWEHLFREEAKARRAQLNLWQQDSRTPIGECDFLLIDSRHEPKHLLAELEANGAHARRFILLHDTTAVPALHTTAVAWGTRHGWTVAERNCLNVGWTLLSRSA